MLNPWSRRFVPGILFLALACRAGESPPGRGPDPLPPPLSRVPASSAEQAAAAELLSRARSAYERGNVVAARQMAEEVVGHYPGAPASSPALWLAARAAFAQGDYGAAAKFAERYAILFPEESRPAREARELAAQSRAEVSGAAAGRPVMPARAVLQVGVILPQSGSPYLKQYADLVLEGVRLAVQAAAGPEMPQIELVVVDDGGDAARAAALIRELEGRGVIGVIGPLLSPAVAAAARSRSDTSLVIISPTASELLANLPNVYSLNAGDVQAAAALAEYAARNGMLRVGLLYPRIRDFQRKGEAFVRVFTRLGGRVVADVPYDSGTTTFAQPIQRLMDTSLDAVFVPVPERDVRQIAPQLAYYGLAEKGVQVLGGEAWVSEEVRRLVEPRFLEGVTAATPLYHSSSEVAWQEFLEAYEATYRRSLDNPFPGLGYDAAQLLLAPLRSGRANPGELAAQVARTAGLRGATGLLSVRGGSVVRRPFLVRLTGGQLVPVAPSSGTRGADGRGGSLRGR
ncbi:MAG: penicillin-binding protein activator [Gemmatimonadetes bacterium]|nr:penicillin-binding protein activator [Gemmatimonadota bacterium]